MGWPLGFSYTRGHWETTTNPDGTKKALYVCSGPFYFRQRGVYIYAGARPTATWAEGYGDEGYLGFIARWLKRHGFGNYGIAVRQGRGFNSLNRRFSLASFFSAGEEF